MANLQISGKRLQISKSNSRMVLIVAIAGFVTMFSLVASKALLSERNYNNKVIGQKELARDQLNQNLSAVNQLETSYKAFTGRDVNILGGNPAGSGDKDGDNAKIVLDALPSKYDFPALVTSINKMFASSGIGVEAITGTDDELAQATTESTEPVEIPFQFELVVGSFADVKNALSITERSIRPFKASALTITADDARIGIELEGVTYYMPERNLKIEKKTVE